MMEAKKGGYANHQWAVVPCGLYCAKYDYLAEKHRLAEMRQPYKDGPTNLSNWLLHLADKTWVDVEALIEAFELALLIHRPKGFDKIDMPASIEKARKEVARNKAWNEWEAEAYPQGIGASLSEFDRKCKEFNAWYKAKASGLPSDTEKLKVGAA